ncbi:MAG: MFS transporter [Rhodothermales bacterium]
MASSIYRSRSVWSWALYDFANSSYTTLVITFIYATYFTQAMVEDANRGTLLWSNAITVTALIVALISPFAGAIADRGGYRKRFLLAATVICVGGTALLFSLQPGQIFLALALVTVTNVMFEMGHVFYNAYLPELAPPDKMGSVSGLGWGLGYIGGLICLAVALVFFIQTDTPIFGLPKDGTHVRATNILVAAWFGLFSIPLFLFVKDQSVKQTVPASVAVREAAKQLKQTFGELRNYKQIVRFLVARLVYNDGLVTIFAFGGIYAAETFGFETSDVIIFGIALNLAAGLGAFVFGFVDDKIGAKPTIYISLGLLILATILAVTTTSLTVFWISGILVGLSAGPNQSASRSLMGRLVPPDKVNEFFGFFAFSGKLTSFMGPLLVGQFTYLFASQRIGVATVLIFFIVGIFLLMRVRETDQYHPHVEA